MIYNIKSNQMYSLKKGIIEIFYDACDSRPRLSWQIQRKALLPSAYEL